MTWSDSSVAAEVATIVEFQAKSDVAHWRDCFRLLHFGPRPETTRPPCICHAASTFNTIQRSGAASLYLAALPWRVLTAREDANRDNISCSLLRSLR